MRDAWRRSFAGILVIFILTIFVNILKITIPLYIFQLLDRVVASQSIDTLILLTTITVFAIVCGALGACIRKWMLIHWATWIEQYFGKQLFLVSLNQPKRRPPARALNDLSDVGDFLAGSAASNWLDALWTPVFLFIVYQIDPRLGLVVLLGMITVVLAGIVGEVSSRPVRKTMRQAGRRSDMWLSTVEQKLETVASLNLTSTIAGRWERSSRRRAGASAVNRLISVGAAETMRLAESIQRIACYAIGVWLVIDGVISVGAVIAAAVLGRFATSGIRKAMQSWRTLILAYRAYKRTSSRLEWLPDSRKPIRDEEESATLHIDQVTHTHSSWSRPLFNMLDVRVGPGQILCIAGASGTGKTTLARLVSGTTSPTMGTVRLGGLDVSRYTEADRQNLVGYMQQQVELLSGTVADNISCLRTAEDATIVEASRLSGAHEFVSRLAQGYETKVDPNKTTFSGGEIRRLGLARAFFGSPPLVVLDEPEANLDADAVAHLTTALEACRERGAILVVTTQRDQLALIADKVIRLMPGGDAIVYESAASYQDSLAQAHRGASAEATTALVQSEERT
jgi:ABC-type protease/lipase transport system fused ATPase/permease subunit